MIINMTRLTFLPVLALVLFASSLASADIVERSFSIQNLTVTRLCSPQVITAVNGVYPGPTLQVRENDTVVIHVSNNSPYNITIHWHGILQRLSGWADGPNMVTQCPIVPGRNYTYRFRVVEQEGTLWWHAHASVLRATVYGAFIIRPRAGSSYPFPTPYQEVPILLGEWWNASVVDLENQAIANGVGLTPSNAYTINGLPGDLYTNCSRNQTYRLGVKRGRTYLLRIINAALDNQLFFKVANHNLRVVAVDASYTTPYNTDVVVIAPGQTTDALLTADQPVGSYYLAASPYASAPGVPFDNTTTRGIIVYDNASTATPIMPIMPSTNDTPTAHRFYSNLTGMPNGPHWVPVPSRIDEHIFSTIGLGLDPCGVNNTCNTTSGTRLSASMNNLSFRLPTGLSMLQAFFFNVAGIYTPDFPNNPPMQFDYTNASINNDMSIMFAPKSTSVKVLKYNATVQMVLQNTAIIGVENHPMHLHGFDFHVLAQGFGNYDPVNDPRKFNLVNPQRRNTIGVPVGGWAVITFIANNPGVWFMHCHLDTHLTWGLGMAFVVQNGPTWDTKLPPPPADLPRC